MHRITKSISLILLIVFFCGNFQAEAATLLERRAAIDVGSGSTKLCIADVEPENNKILRIIHEESFPVPYQASLEKSHDYTFDKQIREKGIETFKKIQNILTNHQVNRITAVATEAFRKATNAESYTKEIQEKTGLDIKIITQKQEGALAFFSALAASSAEREKAVILDIGTGSFQFTTINKEDDVVVFMGNFGSIPFRNYIIDIIQEKDSDEVASPNPMSDDDLKQADKFGRSLARKAFPIIKEKIIAADYKVVGIGRLFFHGIRPLVSNDTFITRDQLRDFIYAFLYLSDAEQNDPFAPVNLSNVILVLSFMKALHIHEIEIVDTSTAQGILTQPSYWAN